MKPADTNAALLPQRRRTLSIMPTFTCPAACADCGTLSSPRERAHLDLDTVLAAIDEARALGFCNVVFTGGEATLEWATLLRGIERAASYRLPVRLVTNAHWATSTATAHDRLTALMAAGLSEINYSTGDEHIRYIPLERVAHACVAACQRKLRTHVMMELKDACTVTPESLQDHPLLQSLTPEQRAYLTILSSPWMPLNHSTVYQYPQGAACDVQAAAMRGGCTSVLKTYTLQADGRVGACCGLGLRVIPELNVSTVDQAQCLQQAISVAEQDFLKLWIHYQGPAKVVAWAATHDPAIRWEGMYAHQCQMCQRLYHDDAIRNVIASHWQEMIAEVMQAAWLDDVHIPETLSQLLHEQD
ncbi:radical SAM protein [Pseudoduganella sp. FT93W]|uniref:Radical SAM protein n=1 Tax=Duganella fentianensis TaxID=2692177 RepID=A0A845HVK8_9BURK|nr:radical SAM protein [Duganella fentianensis]MYN45043.1 radical SAM protein [Duganella fentianensis]